MKSFLLLSFSIIPILVFSQDYQTIRSNREYFFQHYYHYEGDVVGLKIDTSYITKTGDSVFIPNPNFLTIDPESYCKSGEHTSWIGQKILIKENKENVFYNTYNEPIIIKTDAQLGDSWDAHYNSEGGTVTAKVTSHQSKTFLDQLDSVKTITFSIPEWYEAEPSDTFKIEISKKFGIINTPNFYMFPWAFFEYDFDDHMANCPLLGMTNPNIGYQSIKWFDVFDFQVGDEFHYKTERNNYDTRSHLYSKRIYTDRINYPDSIQYKYINTSRNIDDSVWSQVDTLSQTIYQNKGFNRIPLEIIKSGGIISYYIVSSEQPYTKREVTNMYFTSNENDTCLSLFHADGYFEYSKYAKGLGETFFMGAETFEPISNSMKLIYYKKENEEWGIPAKASLLSNNISNTFLIYKKESTLLKVVSSYTEKLYNVELYDLAGNRILNMTSDIQQECKVNDISTGIYIYKLYTNEGLISTDKIYIP